jgi:nicotinamidase-related amidase
MKIENLVNDALPFLQWIGDWVDELPSFNLGQEIEDPARVAVMSVDVINGFCYEGPLSSPRVASIVEPIVSLFESAHALGVQNIILTQDTHEANAVEFGSFPPHCTRESDESEPVLAFKALPFFDQITVIPKNSISSTIGTGLSNWLDSHPEVTTFVVVGDCTDLCTYQLAMALRLRANAFQRADDRVIVPVDCVNTYDLPVAIAQELGAFPHHGDLLHLIFLYSMGLNGVQVVKNIV